MSLFRSQNQCQHVTIPLRLQFDGRHPPHTPCATLCVSSIHLLCGYSYRSNGSSGIPSPPDFLCQYIGCISSCNRFLGLLSLECGGSQCNCLGHAHVYSLPEAEEPHEGGGTVCCRAYLFKAERGLVLSACSLGTHRTCSLSALILSQQVWYARRHKNVCCLGVR